MKTDNGMPEYLSKRTTAEQQMFLQLTDVAAAIPEPDPITRLVFLPNHVGHPHFDDAAAVFWQAVQGLYASQPLSDGELPLVYWGYHSYNILAKRSANGVLLTDRGVYVVDAGRESWALPLESVDASAISGTPESLIIGAATLDLKVAKKLIDPGVAEASGHYLAAVVSAVQQALGVTFVAGAGPTTEEALLASSFAGDVQLPTRPGDTKKLAKISAKWELPIGESVQVAITNSTFAGSYGLVITDAALYSRDLMEPVDRTPRAGIGSIEWVDDPKGFRVRGGHVIPALPSVTPENRDDFAALVSLLLA